MVPCKTAKEAAYVAAVLNSNIARLLVRGYAVSTSTSTHVLEHLSIPSFDASNQIHTTLASLSRKASELAEKGEEGEAALRRVESDVHEWAAKLWGVTKDELREVVKGLEKLS